MKKCPEMCLQMRLCLEPHWGAWVLFQITIVTITFCCDNLWKSKRMALENSWKTHQFFYFVSILFIPWQHQSIFCTFVIWRRWRWWLRCLTCSSVFTIDLIRSSTCSWCHLTTSASIGVRQSPAFCIKASNELLKITFCHSLGCVVRV